MAERFAYPFEIPILDIVKEMDALRAECDAGRKDAQENLTALQTRLNDTARGIVASLDAYQRVQLARHPERPQALDFISRIVDDFIELHGDRRFADDKAVVCGLGTISGRRFAIVGQQKGRDTKERLMRNFGMVHPEGFRKALRVMLLAEKFGLPVLSLIDTKGAAADLEAEQRGEGFAIAESIAAMSVLRAPIIAVVIGEGCSGGALGMAVADRIGMFENAYYCVITPEGCAAILHHDIEKAPQAADAMKITARELAGMGVADEVIPEPPGGAHWNHAAAAESLREFVLRSHDALAAIPLDNLLSARAGRYRKLGAFLEGEAAESEALSRGTEFGNASSSAE
ncbi:MAG TPA: acetyl-CoA carboxylase carboxyltransferase subunit alpha [Candidatus Brocadiia bacterium]|nr:acetyl-CoA carboxylase carboxyltransferase subunit alpha [Candidatus Brocadiia bacterium]